MEKTKTPDVEKPEAINSQVNLLTVPVDNEMIALNVLIGFIGVAQKRGTFAINESAKIFECIQKFSPVDTE
jgi:hypothetical protein